MFYIGSLKCLGGGPNRRQLP